MAFEWILSEMPVKSYDLFASASSIFIGGAGAGVSAFALSDQEWEWRKVIGIAANSGTWAMIAFFWLYDPANENTWSLQKTIAISLVVGIGANTITGLVISKSFWKSRIQNFLREDSTNGSDHD